MSLPNQSLRRAHRVVRAVIEDLEARRLYSAGTLRIVTYNIDADTTTFENNNQSAGLETILEGIGAEHLSDGGTSNAQPVDVFCPEELYNSSGGPNAPTLASIISNLNSHYGAGTYAYDTTTDPTTGGTGGGPSGLIYNTHTVQDLGATEIVADSGSGAPRAVLQYKLQPVGYATTNVFYVDVSHAKSGTDSSSISRRGVEAQGIVNSLSSLPAGAHVISLGDFNITNGSSEQTYQTMVSKFDDVAMPSESWNDSSTSGAKAISNLLSESATDVRYRDDIQFVTPSMDPASASKTPGLQYAQGSMMVFGNGGAQSLEGNAITNSTANPGALSDLANASTVLSDETTTTDHLPVVADYVITNSIPTWLAAGSAATWNASSKTLTVTGAATIIADPSTDEPNIIANGAPAQVVVQLPTGTFSDVHVGGVSLSNGAGLDMKSVGASRTHNDHNVLVLGTLGATTDPTVSVTTGSTINLEDNDLIVHTGTSDTTGKAELATIQALAATGRNVPPGGVFNGTWNGKGLTSSAAAAIDAAVGYEQNIIAVVENSDLFLGSFSKWQVGSASENVGANDIIVKYTYNGDLTLEGAVTDNAATVFSTFYDGGATTQNDYAFGDLNGDGKVDDTDATIFSTVYGNGTAGSGLPLL